MAASPVSESDGDVPDIPTRYSTAWAVLGFACAAAALVIVPLVTGAVGMAAGSIAHLKGSRLGMPAAIASGIGLIAGMANHFLLR
jgi:hypothetical protein